MPLTPINKQNFRIPCGRKAGYESIEVKLPKSIVAEKGAVVQLEFSTPWGTVIQCADIIVQRQQLFHQSMCEPKCKNGGVCMNGLCKCSKMYTGDYCQTKVNNSSSLSLLLYILFVALVAVGIGLLFLKE